MTDMKTRVSTDYFSRNAQTEIMEFTLMEDGSIVVRKNGVKAQAVDKDTADFIKELMKSEGWEYMETRVHYKTLAEAMEMYNLAPVADESFPVDANEFMDEVVYAALRRNNVSV